jgi:hypothetical protein
VEADLGPSLVLRALRMSGVFRRWLRRMLEHLQHSRPLSRLRPSVALDVLPQLLGMVAARRLVREFIGAATLKTSRDSRKHRNSSRKGKKGAKKINNTFARLAS